MSHILRLRKALARQGIVVHYDHGIYVLRNLNSTATVLLPASLPLEANGVAQLMAFAAVRSVDGSQGVIKACATPDFHPGSTVPVGTIVATDEDFVIPAAIGTDINCGMRMLTTGLSKGTLAPHMDVLIGQLKRVLLEGSRDVPLRPAAYRALFDVGPAAFIDRLHAEGLWQQVDRDRLHREIEACVSLGDFQSASRYAPEALTGPRDVIRDPSLGTAGAGNHFVEFQVIDKVFDRHAAYGAGLAVGDVVVMIHSGSRDVGFYVGQRWMDRAREAWPRGVKHPDSKLYGLSGPLAKEYLVAMGTAARYAWANRVVLSELVRWELAKLTGVCRSHLVVDVPHNVVLAEGGMNIHRKGATPAHGGQLALIPGSMGDASFVVLGLGNPDWLWSCSHGAGRSVRRQAMRRVHHSDDAAAGWHCVTLREERRIEEGPHAYKPIGPVLDAQEEAGLIRNVARLRPWVTFKS